VEFPAASGKLTRVRAWLAICSVHVRQEAFMKRALEVVNNANGKLGWILLWALGIPIPVLVVLWLIRGGT
jgi:hypothetical protein